VFQAEPKPPVQGVMQVREDKIVGRDIVGYGLNGEPQYFDSLTFPFPSVRFQKNTPEIVVRPNNLTARLARVSRRRNRTRYRNGRNLSSSLVLQSIEKKTYRVWCA